MVYSFKQFFLLTLLFSVFLHAENIEDLIHEYTNKNVLSKSTIDKNRGHLLLYSRDRLERMHAKTLKDVLKTIPILTYIENRYGFPDPLSTGGISPYSSNQIRVFIDDVEVTHGWMGSGIIQYGDINIDFADHIDLYAIPPSFETSSESAYMTIFIYSKIPERDGRATINLTQDNHSSNTQTLSYGNENDTFSYMVNVSHTNMKHEKIENGTDKPLSKDFERTQLFSYIKNENQAFHLQVIDKKSDTLAGLSLDATPLISKMDTINVHMDYKLTFAEFWKIQLAYDYLTTDMRQEDNLPLLVARPGGLFGNTFNLKTKNSTYSAGLTYANVFDKHHISFGLKGRVKSFDSLDIEDIGELFSPFDEERIMSIFFQDQYALSENKLITLGIKYSNVSRHAIYDEDNLFEARLGYLYDSDVWSYKAYLFRNEFTVDPFDRFINPSMTGFLDPQVTVGFTQELTYKTKTVDSRIMTFYLKEKNNLIDINNINDTSSFVTVFNSAWKIDNQNTFTMQLAHAYYMDIENIGDVNGYSAYLSLSNMYDEFNIYNGLVCDYDTYKKEQFFNWTSSVSWNINHSVTFTLKGENLLDKAKTYDIFRLNPLDGSMISPLKVTPFDRRVSLELEYRF